MAITRISGNQIAASTEAVLTTLSFAEADSVLTLPSGTENDQPASPDFGTLRFNTDIDNAEIYVSDDGTGNPGWTAVAGGGPSLGTDSVIRTNSNVIEEDITVGPTANGGDAKFTNAFSSGPMTIGNGWTVTIESGASWSLI